MHACNILYIRVEYHQQMNNVFPEIATEEKSFVKIKNEIGRSTEL